jgi:hypothetical protein
MVCQAVVDYFKSESWQELMTQMARGKEVRHAHIYAESILHPGPLMKVIAGYFESQGLPLQRKIYLLPPGSVHGMSDIYNIHPRPDMGHFELIMRYSPHQVLAPMPLETTSAGKVVEVWDEKYMETVYARYNFKTRLTPQDEKDLVAYFNSAEWKMQYNFMLSAPNRHTHSLVETSIHPEILQEYAIKAMEARGWEVTRACSIVYVVKGFDIGKITFLLKKPEIMIELEWDFNPDVSIRSGSEPMVGMTTAEDLDAAMCGLDYIKLDDDAVQAIVSAF